MATLTELFSQAQKTRHETRLLRAELKRLTATNGVMRHEQLVQRRLCYLTPRRAGRNREHLPTWPAWSAPGPELRSTLVPLD